MALLSSKAEGSTFKLREDRTPVEFYVAKHDYESGLNGKGRTLVVRKEAYEEGVWNTGGLNGYATSDINNSFQSYKNRFDYDIQDKIGTTKFYYTVGNYNWKVEVLERSIFALSCAELGKTGSNINAEGSTLPIASLLCNISQWTRSPATYDTTSAIRITEHGDVSYENCANHIGRRPAFTLPSNLEVDIPPTTPSSISFGVPEAGKPLQITCGVSTDPDSDQIVYVFERQIDSGSWEQIASSDSTEVTDTVPSEGTTYNVRVKAKDGEGNESDYRTGTAKAIVYNQPPSIPASIAFGDPHAGKSLQITCEASTDPDGNTITYIWERQIDSGDWVQIGSGASTSITDTVPSSGINYNVRVKARDSEGAESGYRTGSAKAIIYNQPPTIPGVPQYKYPIPGEEMPVKWQASTDPESGAVTYIVETKLGDGEWTQARETPETSCLVNVSQVSAAGTMITVRVKAKDQEGAESAYSTGEAAEILYHKVIRKIPWQRGKPFKARQYTYNGKKQYQTMREGALAGIEAKP